MAGKKKPPALKLSLQKLQQEQLEFAKWTHKRRVDEFIANIPPESSAISDYHACCLFAW
jgi:hypothetical protein